MARTQVIVLTLVLSPDSSGGFVVTSPDLPELVTEGDTVEEALANVRDAIHAVRELYEDTGRPFPQALVSEPSRGPLTFKTVIEAA